MEQIGTISDEEKDYFKKTYQSPIFPVDFQNSGSAEVTKLAKNEKLLEILKNASLQMDPLKVIPGHMKWVLNNAFGEIPRNHKFDINNDSGWKNTMSGYIWYKFGELGYLTCHQAFKARQFLHEFDKVTLKLE